MFGLEEIYYKKLSDGYLFIGDTIYIYIYIYTHTHAHTPTLLF